MDDSKRNWSVGRIAILGCLVVAIAPSWAGADETLLCNRHITSVPFVINKPGHYCLVGNLTTSMASGIAIRITSDNVWLDLNNYALDGSAAGPSTTAIGIESESQKHVTVRNGLVRGFDVGIEMGDMGAEGLAIEGIRADGNLRTGIQIFATGEGNVVRGNRISNTGGTTCSLCTGRAGLAVVGDVSVIDNDVVNTFSSHPQPNNSAFGIYFAGPPGVAYRAIAVNNRVTRSSDVGIQCNNTHGAEVVLRDNIVMEAPQPYFDCTLIGTTNYP